MEKLGIQLPLLLIQIVNFTILIFILKKVLYKPILKLLDSRRKNIEEGLLASQKAQEELTSAEIKSQNIIKEAKNKANELIKLAKNEAEVEKQQIIKEAKKEIDEKRLLEEDNLKAKQLLMTKEVKKDVVEISAKLVERLLPKLITNQNQRNLIKASIKTLSGKND